MSDLFKVGFVPKAIAFHDRPQGDSIEKIKQLPKLNLLINFFNPNSKENVTSYLKYLEKAAYLRFITLKFRKLKSILSE